MLLSAAPPRYIIFLILCPREAPIRLANKAPLLRAGVVTCLVVEARAAKISAIESGGCSGCAKAAGFGFS